MYKVESFLNCKEQLLRTASYLIGQAADLIGSISFGLSNIDSKTNEQYEMDIGKPVNCIIKTIFKNNKMSRLLTKKIENFPGIYIELKKIECIVNVRYQERTIKSSLLTTLTKQLLFLKDAIGEKKENVCKCLQVYSPFVILASSI
jgi:hypothetical protein